MNLSFYTVLQSLGSSICKFRVILCQLRVMEGSVPWALQWGKIETSIRRDWIYILTVASFV